MAGESNTRMMRTKKFKLTKKTMKKLKRHRHLSKMSKVKIQMFPRLTVLNTSDIN